MFGRIFGLYCRNHNLEIFFCLQFIKIREYYKDKLAVAGTVTADTLERWWPRLILPDCAAIPGESRSKVQDPRFVATLTRQSIHQLFHILNITPFGPTTSISSTSSHLLYLLPSTQHPPPIPLTADITGLSRCVQLLCYFLLFQSSVPASVPSHCISL
jgi:hypothetical protein